MDDRLKNPDINRLLAAFAHRDADRVPNFEITINGRGISHILGIQTDQGLWQITPESSIKVVKGIGQDAIPCPLQFHLEQGSICNNDDFERMKKSVVYPDVKCKLESYLKAVKGTNIGVCPCLSGSLTAAYLAAGPVSIESFMIMIFEQPDLVGNLLDFYMEYTLNVIRQIKDLPFHFIYVGDDVTGFVGPDRLSELWAGRHERIIRAAKATGKPVMCHCCGPMADVLPYFKKWEVDAIHPMQTNVNDIYQIHRDYPGFALVGNIDINLLSFGKKEEVVSDTKTHIDRLSDDNSYVVCSSHSIIDSVIPENFLAMVETAWNSCGCASQ
ncbi:MAG: uroporphyrinogen decarboxylase family protein [Victivallales bacterium]